MRSRYSAFVRGDAAYLLATWHPRTRPPAPLALTPGVTWLGLEVRHHEPSGDTATVAFEARSTVRGRAHRLVETSRFVREDGRWYYVDGDITP
jgi:SEC-C motif-containing protein